MHSELMRNIRTKVYTQHNTHEPTNGVAEIKKKEIN